MTFCYTDLLGYATVSAWCTHVKLSFLLPEKYNGHSQIFLSDVKFDLYLKHTQKVLPTSSNLVFYAQSTITVISGHINQPQTGHNQLQTGHNQLQLLDFNVLSTAQGHLRTIKLCHKQMHIFLFEAVSKQTKERERKKKDGS